MRNLYSQAWHYTSNTHDAEDVLLELYGKQEQMAAVQNLPAWLNRCLYNRFIDRHRRQGRTPILEDISEQGNQAALARPGTTESDCMHTQVLSRMQQLNPVQRAVISLHDISGFSLPGANDRSPESVPALLRGSE